jgi:hypothetical protein
MAIMTITYPARCKHCKFLEPEYIGKKKIHKCKNPDSRYYNTQMTLKDYVCPQWNPFWV